MNRACGSAVEEAVQSSNFSNLFQGSLYFIDLPRRLEKDIKKKFFND